MESKRKLFIVPGALLLALFFAVFMGWLKLDGCDRRDDDPKPAVVEEPKVDEAGAPAVGPDGSPAPAPETGGPAQAPSETSGGK